MRRSESQGPLALRPGPIVKHSFPSSARLAAPPRPFLARFRPIDAPW